MKRFSALSVGLFFFAAAVPADGQPSVGVRHGQWPAQGGVHASASAVASAANLPIVMSARVGEHDDRTRFVIEVSDPVKLRVFTLSNPDRVVIDMPEVLWRIVGGPQKPSGLGAIRSYRYGLYRPGDARFVIDLNMPVNAAEPLILPPSGGFGYRVVLDLFPSTRSAFEAKSGWPADLHNDSGGDQIAQIIKRAAETKKDSRKVIVVDAGHGGLDSGTVGVDGLMEKNLVLDEAQRLAKVLRTRGFVVHLTRDNDTFVPLRGRVAIARAHKADLFISLHADSNPDPNVKGASVYTLSEAGSDKEAAALAKKENQSDIIAGVDLSGDNSSVASILIDLAQRDTMNRSSRFAEAAVARLATATDILARAPHRSAAFAVLKAPDVPAVLIELGYLSNAHDDNQMGTDRWRNEVADAIARAVERHFRSTAPMATQAAD